MKSLFKKKSKYPTPQAPRTTDEIRKEYYEARAKAGETQYQIVILRDELSRLNNVMRDLNNENFERQKLDAEVKKAETAATKEA